MIEYTAGEDSGAYSVFEYQTGSEREEVLSKSRSRPNHYTKHIRCRPRKPGTKSHRRKLRYPMELHGDVCKAEVVNLKRHIPRNSSK